MDTYNGWRNYPTWRVWRYITTHKEAHASWYKEASRCLEKWHGRNAIDRLASDLASAFSRDSFILCYTEIMSEDYHGMLADILGDAFEHVDCHEIAKALIEDVEAGKEEDGKTAGAAS